MSSELCLYVCTYYSSAGSLTEDDLRDILNLLEPVKSEWRNLGVQLKIDLSYLDSIQQDANNRMTNMIAHWMRNSPDTANWDTLIDALQMIGRRDIAKKALTS